MQVVVVAAQKGGSGKTTLTGHLAVSAERAGAGPVAVIDTDPQGSLAEWWNARRQETPLFARSGPGRLARDIEQLRALGLKLLVIDTPPAISDIIREVLACADIVVVPVRPSPHDLRAVGATVDLIENAGKPFVFVVNAATGARMTNDAAMALSQHGPLAPAIIRHRTAFAGAMIDGRTVMEVPNQASAVAEAEQLWAYISRRLAGTAAAQAAEAVAGRHAA